MFKDYDKYLKTSLKVYIFVLIIIFILKIVGLDYFGIDVNNLIVIRINELANKFNLIYIYYSLNLYVYIYCFISIVLKDNSKYIKIFSIIYTIIDIICILTIKKYMNRTIIFFFDLIFIFIGCLITNKFKFKGIIKRFILYFFVNILFQVISLITRNNFQNVDQEDFIRYFILNFDYILLTLIIYNVVFMKGGKALCGTEDHYLSSLKKTNLKKSLQKLLKNLQSNLKKFKKKSTEEKLTIIIYIILSLIWNTLSVVLILIVAKLNDRLIECIFILTSFWLSKGKFGKSFHFNSMVVCFIVSNLTYYSLNRITTSLGISILIPVILGVGLSYVTSKFVKNTYKPLYRGMPEDVFEETILKVVDKDSIKYKICREFYMDNASELSLSFKYNYSIPGIRKIKERINEKIKKL